MLTVWTVVLLGIGPVPYLADVQTPEDFAAISRSSRSRPDIESESKFLTPASDAPELLATIYQNVNVHTFHIDLMASEFPDHFPGIDESEYAQLVQRRATRRYFAGNLMRIRTRAGETLWGFDFYTDPRSPEELPLEEEVTRVHAQLSATFALRPLVYAPVRSDVIAMVREWVGTLFDVYLPSGGFEGNFTAYTVGTAYGRVRIYTLPELLEADEAGSLTPEDLIVVDEAPGDLTSPIAGVVTGSPQAELSHLSLRLAQRGTPNAFLADPRERFTEFEGQLLRVDITEADIDIRPAELAEAEAWWESHRPRLPAIPGADLMERVLRPLDEIASLDDASTRYGAKASNTALLRTVLAPEHVVDGFAVPFAWYQQFLEESRIPWAGVEGGISYVEYLELLENDETFRSDSEFRAQALGYFVEQAEDEGRVAPELVEQIISRIESQFGSAEVKMRFRSSANFEDIIPFNGAGLYESTSGCAADNLDDDNDGPSRCDPEQARERRIERALRRVWASNWLARAYNERAFWQAPHDRAKMGVLVNPAFVEELANGVVLSGNPTTPGDDRVLINVQRDDVSVVDPAPGVLPEKLLVDVEDEMVTRVDRLRASTLMPEGEWILSIEEASTIARLVSRVHAALAPRWETPLGEVLVDLEFKVVRQGDSRQIVFKQVRPFLRDFADEAPTLAILVPEGTVACGVFQEFRSLDEETRLLSQLVFLPGRLELPGRPGTTRGELIEEIRVGRDRVLAEEVGPGEFTCETRRDGTLTHYDYSFRQEFRVGERPLVLDFVFPAFTTSDTAPERDRLEWRLDDRSMTLDLDVQSLQGELGSGEVERLHWSSCEFGVLSEFDVTAEAVTGERIDLLTRFEQTDFSTGWEALVRAELQLGDRSRVVTDYWDLVYAADHHNAGRRYRAVVQPPMPLGPGEAEVAWVEFHEAAGRPFPRPVAFRLLDSSFNTVRELEVASWSRERRSNAEAPDFIRGDANADGTVDITDAIRTLDGLFQAGEALSCLDAADADDDGHINVADPVRILGYLFRDNPILFGPPWPGPTLCGRDLEPDRLETCVYPVSSCPLGRG